ncbi:MAG: membrane protein insertase YidC, partial [Granulosicoccus sp.]|nr:membrane protein insertase YidC [Granulosicoccus sp.]
MDFRRIMLFGALGLVLAMLWQSWVQFQIDHDPANPAAVANQSGQTAATSVADDVPTAPAVVSDVPGTAVVAADTPSEPEVEMGGRLINVSTDLVNAKISTQGGNLVHLELIKHPVSVESPDEPFVLMHQTNGALNVAQSGLIGSDREYPNHTVEFQSNQSDVTLDSNGEAKVVLVWTAPDGIVYQKIYTFRKDSYQIDVEFQVANNSATNWTGFLYGQLKQTEIRQEGSMGFLGRLPSYNGAAIYTAEEKYDKVDYSEISDEPLNVSTTNGWVAMLQHYFVSAWLPQGSDSYQLYSGVSRNTVLPEYRIGFKQTQP